MRSIVQTLEMIMTLLRIRDSNFYMDCHLKKEQAEMLWQQQN